jgi:hypothetical protein
MQESQHDLPRTLQISKRRRDTNWLGCLLALALLVAPIANAQPPVSDDKPFAEHFLVLQISDDDPETQNHVLSVAANLLEYYGPDMIDIEIVAFGPGIHLLFADNERTERIASLDAQGVRFDGCMNTIDTITRETGHKPDLSPDMIPVKAGVAQILALTEKGYTLVRP